MRKVRIKKLPVARGGAQVPYGNQTFSANTLNDYSDPKTEVNRTLQPVKKGEAANIEAEKGEVAVTNYNGSDTGQGLTSTPSFGDGIPETYIIGGKRHAQGGTALDIPEGSFIFSDYKKGKDGERGMKISNEGALEMFGMKGPSTPADIAKKYNLNDYKKRLLSGDTDQYDKTTSELMINNYMHKLGGLALIQEAHKGFPNGVPDIAMPYLQTNNIDPQMFMPQEEQGQQQQMPEQGMPEQPMARYGMDIPRAQLGNLPIKKIINTAKNLVPSNLPLAAFPVAWATALAKYIKTKNGFDENPEGITKQNQRKVVASYYDGGDIPMAQRGYFSPEQREIRRNRRDDRRDDRDDKRFNRFLVNEYKDAYTDKLSQDYYAKKLDEKGKPTLNSDLENKLNELGFDEFKDEQGNPLTFTGEEGTTPISQIYDTEQERLTPRDFRKIKRDYRSTIKEGLNDEDSPNLPLYDRSMDDGQRRTPGYDDLGEGKRKYDYNEYFNDTDERTNKNAFTFDESMTLEDVRNQYDERNKRRNLSGFLDSFRKDDTQDEANNPFSDENFYANKDQGLYANVDRQGNARMTGTGDQRVKDRNKQILESHDFENTALNPNTRANIDAAIKGDFNNFQSIMEKNIGESKNGKMGSTPHTPQEIAGYDIDGDLTGKKQMKNNKPKQGIRKLFPELKNNVQLFNSPQSEMMRMMNVNMGWDPRVAAALAQGLIPSEDRSKYLKGTLDIDDIKGIDLNQVDPDRLLEELADIYKNTDPNTRGENYLAWKERINSLAKRHNLEVPAEISDVSKDSRTKVVRNIPEMPEGFKPSLQESMDALDAGIISSGMTSDPAVIKEQNKKIYEWLNKDTFSSVKPEYKYGGSYKKYQGGDEVEDMVTVFGKHEGVEWDPVTKKRVAINTKDKSFNSKMSRSKANEFKALIEDLKIKKDYIEKTYWKTQGKTKGTGEAQHVPESLIKSTPEGLAYYEALNKLVAFTDQEGIKIPDLRGTVEAKKIEEINNDSTLSAAEKIEKIKEVGTIGTNNLYGYSHHNFIPGIQIHDIVTDEVIEELEEKEKTPMDVTKQDYVQPNYGYVNPNNFLRGLRIPPKERRNFVRTPGADSDVALLEKDYLANKVLADTNAQREMQRSYAGNKQMIAPDFENQMKTSNAIDQANVNILNQDATRRFQADSQLNALNARELSDYFADLNKEDLNYRKRWLMRNDIGRMLNKSDAENAINLGLLATDQYGITNFAPNFVGPGNQLDGRKSPELSWDELRQLPKEEFDRYNKMKTWQKQNRASAYTPNNQYSAYMKGLRNPNIDPRYYS